MEKQKINIARDNMEDEKERIKNQMLARNKLENIFLHIFLIPVYIAIYSMKALCSIVLIALILSPPAVMLLFGLLTYALVHENTFSITGYLVLFGLLAIAESFVFIVGVLWIFEMLVPELKSIWEQED